MSYLTEMKDLKLSSYRRIYNVYLTDKNYEQALRDFVNLTNGNICI